MSPTERDLCRARDDLAEASPEYIASALTNLAGALRRYADNGSDWPDSDRLAALTVRLICDAHLAATGPQQGRQFTGSALEPLLGEVLDRMAAEPDLRARAAFIADLAALLADSDGDAAEEIACLPYGGLVGGRDRRYLPSTVRGLVRSVARWAVS